MDRLQVRREICEIGALLYSRGYVISNDGNISVRIADDEVIITPSGVGKGRMTPDMLVHTDMAGNVLEGARHPSSEIQMHLAVYRGRADARAVVHAHPPAATAFAICRQPLCRMYMPEIALGLGTVPVAPFAMPSTREVPDSVAPFVGEGNSVLLANHGALTWGGDAWKAFDFMELVEYTAKINLYVAQIGSGVELTGEERSRVEALRTHYQALAGARQ